MFDIKKFTAFIAFNDELRNAYYDKAESQGVDSTWDVYHIQEGTEIPSRIEINIMEDIFNDKIKTNPALLKIYTQADLNFRENVKSKLKRK